MPLIRIDAGPDGTLPLADVAPGLAAALKALPPGAPVVVLIHGFRFSPHRPGHDPHAHILALDPEPGCWKAISWPRHLGFGRAGDPAEGLCIAFGWHATGTIWQAFGRAAQAGAALAEVLALVADLAPGRPTDVLAHSLGARVILSALPLAPRGSVGRMILMAGAEFRSTARAAMASPAGQAAEVINISSRENDLFDAAMEALIAPPCPRDRALGHPAPVAAANWLDLQIDQDETLRGLAHLGHRIAPPHLRVCHWSAYLRPGLFPLYRALLRERETLPLALLRATLPERAAPRWSRLLALRVARLPLPLPRNASS